MVAKHEIGDGKDENGAYGVWIFVSIERITNVPTKFHSRLALPSLYPSLVFKLENGGVRSVKKREARVKARKIRV